MGLSSVSEQLGSKQGRPGGDLGKVPSGVRRSGRGVGALGALFGHDATSWPKKIFEPDFITAWKRLGAVLEPSWAALGLSKAAHGPH